MNRPQLMIGKVFKMASSGHSLGHSLIFIHFFSRLTIKTTSFCLFLAIHIYQGMIVGSCTGQCIFTKGPK
jgi:hypothetical protein